MTFALFAWACGRPVSTPSAIPSPTPSTEPSAEVAVGFIIVTGMNVLGIGATTPFTVTAYPAYPSPTRDYLPFDVTRQADWVSSDPGVATIASNGLVTARIPGATEISASYKGKSYSLPLLVVDSGASQSLSRYAGAWSGDGEFTCQRLSGVGRSVCDPSPFGTPSTLRNPIHLTLTVAGNVLAGTLELYQSPMTAPVQAALLDDGQLAIGGTLGGGSEHAWIVQLREWRLSLRRDGRLVGVLIEDSAFVNVYSPQLQRERLEVNGLARRGAH